MNESESEIALPKLNAPWLVAVWPGMGSVALSAGFYLMSKLGMHLLGEFSPRELFDLDHVEVKGGLIQSARTPRSRFFVWQDPDKKRDLVVFIGEAQPPVGKYALCSRLVEFVRQIGVERVFTFAAMAMQMHPEHPSRVFVAATDAEMLDELSGFDLHPKMGTDRSNKLRIVETEPIIGSRRFATENRNRRGYVANFDRLTRCKPCLCILIQRGQGTVQPFRPARYFSRGDV
jgi:proteasome assembly chaperone (PAC2) family protein